MTDEERATLRDRINQIGAMVHALVSDIAQLNQSDLVHLHMAKQYTEKALIALTKATRP